MRTRDRVKKQEIKKCANTKAKEKKEESIDEHGPAKQLSLNASNKLKYKYEYIWFECVCVCLYVCFYSMEFSD